MKIMIINGANLNMLGIRERGIYGTKNYDESCDYIKKECDALYGDKLELTFFQSNSEGAIIDCLHSCYFDNYDGVIINPGAYTHYSYAILDAIKSININTVEVHISDIKSREKFREVSVTKSACIAQICGQGLDGYVAAAKLLMEAQND